MKPENKIHFSDYISFVDFIAACVIVDAYSINHHMSRRMASNFTLRNTDFAAEFARFVNFIGASELHEAVSRVAVKLAPLAPSLLALYLDRYFFHVYCQTIADGPIAFQLNVSDANAIRVASFVAGINRMKSCLSARAASRFRSNVLGSLRPDRDIRHLEHEVRTFVHLGQKKVATTLADLEQLGKYDMFCKLDGHVFEVECKTVTEDTGEQIKTDLHVSLSELCRGALESAVNPAASGVFVLTFAKSPSLCRELHAALRNGLTSALPLRSDDFELTFTAKSEWGSSTPSETVRRDLEVISHKYSAWKFGDRVLGLALLPHKPSKLAQKIISSLKYAADQCSGQSPSLLWLHLIGHAEDEFLEVAQFSLKGEGAGLNAIVANVLHPRASPTDRSHVHKIRFSAEPADITQKPVLDGDLMIRKANSLSGLCYDVPNPFCRFTLDVDA